VHGNVKTQPLQQHAEQINPNLLKLKFSSCSAAHTCKFHITTANIKMQNTLLISGICNYRQLAHCLHISM